MYERRRHDRYQVNIAAELRCGGSQPPAADESDGVNCTLTQLSLTGGFVRHELGRMRIGDMLELRFALPGQPETIGVHGVVRWTEPSGTGVQFGSMRAREVWQIDRFLASFRRASTRRDRSAETSSR